MVVRLNKHKAPALALKTGVLILGLGVVFFVGWLLGIMQNNKFLLRKNTLVTTNQPKYHTPDDTFFKGICDYDFMNPYILSIVNGENDLKVLRSGYLGFEISFPSDLEIEHFITPEPVVVRISKTVPENQRTRIASRWEHYSIILSVYPKDNLSLESFTEQRAATFEDYVVGKPEKYKQGEVEGYRFFEKEYRQGQHTYYVFSQDTHFLVFEVYESVPFMPTYSKTVKDIVNSLKIL